ncbi:hypothetical protein V8D89_004982, partial [Ganoderma adspersum]
DIPCFPPLPPSFVCFCSFFCFFIHQFACASQFAVSLPRASCSCSVHRTLCYCCPHRLSVPIPSNPLPHPHPLQSTSSSPSPSPSPFPDL